jgi:ABC-type nitrate/sulfonate/bicarbonate transport system ATPase subunit
VLDIEGLTVRYGTREGPLLALSNVNLQIKDGDFVVAIGASGCGKTTLLSRLRASWRRAKARSGSTASPSKVLVRIAAWSSSATP